jgi:hypothetical protein
MTPLATIDTTSTYVLKAWQDPIVDRLGHDPRSRYCERFWLPVLGPSTVCLLRHLVGRLEEEPSGARVDLAEVARAIGLGEHAGRSGAFARTFTRAIDFDMARLVGSTIAVRRRIPPLPRRHLARLSVAARTEHEALMRDGHDGLEAKARQLALSLARLGEDAAATERQLRRWRFDADLARRCALWAASVAEGSAHPPAVAKAPAEVTQASICNLK